MKIAETLETVYPCHLTQHVRSGRGERPCLNTKPEHYLLCGEAHHAQPAQRMTGTCGSIHGALSPSQNKVGPALPEENDIESTQGKKEQTLLMLLEKLFFMDSCQLLFYPL